jgi:hypothetical protein
MDFNSPIFDRIRVKRTTPREERKAAGPTCDHPGCDKPGDHRAPMGRDREGQYFCFCMDHVREYNATYNYFKDMTDADVARWMKDDFVGHRPTWAMGVNRSGRNFREDPQAFRDPHGFFGDRTGAKRKPEPQSHVSIAARKALGVLGLDEGADKAAIKARYKEMVKAHHPDLNGGDRTSEDKLRDIIRAYNTLKKAKLA